MRALKHLVPAGLRRRLRRRLDAEAATPDDLRQCYRLLLGREPDAAGWRTYAEALAGGIRREDLVFSFVASPEFRKRHGLAPVERAEPRVATVDGIEILVGRPDSPVGRALLEQGRYEPHVAAALERALEPGAVLVDVGANVGALSLLGARRVGPAGRVLAFEPDPVAAALLELSARRNGFAQITVHPYAVTDRAAMLLYEESGGNGLVRPLEKSSDLTSGQVVRAVVLDELLPRGQRVDVIKLDVEGHEPRALAGALGLLERARPVVLTELAPAALVEAGCAPADFLSMLTSRGYGLAVLEADGERTDLGGDGAALLAELERRRVGHLDLEARPLSA